MTARMRCLTAFISSERDVRLVTPDEAERAPRLGIENAMMKVLARDFRWQMMLAQG